MNQPRTGATSRALRSATLRFAGVGTPLPFARNFCANFPFIDATLARTKKDAHCQHRVPNEASFLNSRQFVYGGVNVFAREGTPRDASQRGHLRKGALDVKTRELSSWARAQRPLIIQCR